MAIQSSIRIMGVQARVAAQELLAVNTRRKTVMLEAMANALEARRDDVLAANARDLEQAVADGLGASVEAQLRLTPARVDHMVRRIRDVAVLQNPVGVTVSRWLRPNGLEIIKKRVPVGVIALIYESRPHVTADAAALCLKTSNAVILRGGHAAIQTNTVIADALIEGGISKGMPEHAVQFVRTVEYEAVRELLGLQGIVDLAIPRGGGELMQAVEECARVPVIKQFKGVCHTYVDADADLDMAEAVVLNAKCQHPEMPNATETLIVHRALLDTFLPRMCAALAEAGVRLHGDESVQQKVADVEPVPDGDWSTEYLDLAISIRVVDSVDAAIHHINTYGTHHSDAIITRADATSNQFVQEVDSAAVYVNASTRFTDGAEFGMGAEVGVSTEKLHARGPMGLLELTTIKYIINGRGQIRES